MVAATAYLILRGARRPASFSFGLAVLAKIIPVILLPFVLKRIGKRNCALSSAVILGAYIPFTRVGGEIFKGTLTFARALCGLTILGVVCCLAQRDDGQIRTFAPYAAESLGAVIMLGPTAMPWYVAWILPLAVISGGPVMRLWICYSALV